METSVTGTHEVSIISPRTHTRTYTHFQRQYVLGHHKESRDTLTFNLIPHLPFPTGCQWCQHAPPLELIWEKKGMPSHMEAETSVREPQRS
ncbi:hypothetical protein AOLI_G00144350 [Acnodon oligacanthus]